MRAGLYASPPSVRVAAPSARIWSIRRGRITLGAMSLYTVETYGRLQPHVGQEWLLTNGLGGFAMGTVVGCNTRRYHGLLCAATLPPVGRVMALNRIGEVLFLDGKTAFLELSVNQYGRSFHPGGDKYLRRLHRGRTVEWDNDAEGIRIDTEI